MEAVNDVMNPIVIRAHRVNPINVNVMEAENDVLNQIVKKVQKVKLINV
jgi:hypothetical protein